MSERQYDPIFSGGLAPKSTIEDVARDHAMRQAHCGCSICWMAGMVRKNAAKKAEAERERALTEKLMKEWP